MDWINLPLLPALGNALLHSLWQFTLLAGLGFLVSKQTSKAALRHNIYLTTLLLFPIVFATTFWLALPQNLATSVVINTSPNMVNVVADEVAMPAAVPIWSWLSDHLLEIMAMVYLFGLLVLGLRSGRDWWQIRQLRQTSMLPSPELAEVYTQLRTQLPTLANYPLRISSRVNSALTVGIFRPFILLPISLVNALSPAEVEAILLHEMAHLFRKDHLWNALQTLLTQLFFYHPMVHWLRIQLDREREYACDDLVTGRINREVYAQSLLKVARLSITHKNQFIMQAQGKSHFTQRVQRLFLPPARPQARRWWLLPVLFFPCFFTVMLSAQQPELQTMEPATETEQITPFGNPATTLYFFNGKRYDNYEDFVHLLQTDNYTQVCGETDPELQQINADESKDYKFVARFYTGEDREKAMQEQGVNALTIDDRGPVSSSTTVEAEAVSIEADEITTDAELPNALTIDGVVVHQEADTDTPQLQLEGRVITFHDQEEPATQARSVEDGVEYGGLIEVETVMPNSGEQPNPVGAISAANDSLLILLDGKEIERDELNALDPNTIESINVIKGEKIPAKYQGTYNGVIEINLKKGADRKKSKRKDGEGVYFRIDGKTSSSTKELIELGDNISEEKNVRFYIDDVLVGPKDYKELAKDNIKSIDVIKDKEKLKKLGCEDCDGVIKIKTKKKTKIKIKD